MLHLCHVYFTTIKYTFVFIYKIFNNSYRKKIYIYIESTSLCSKKVGMIDISSNQNSSGNSMKKGFFKL